MIQHDDKQEIAQLLSKFMAGESSVAEEEVLAQYFRTHEVDEEWAEYKEMFTLFDNGQVDIEIEDRTSEQPIKDDNEKTKMLPKAVREKPKIVALRWLMAGIAASIALFRSRKSSCPQRKRWKLLLLRLLTLSLPAASVPPT